MQDRWAGGSLIRRLKGPFAVFWPSQLSKWNSYNYFFTTVTGNVDNKIQMELYTFPICIYTNTMTWKFSTANQPGLASLWLLGCTNLGQMPPTFIKSSKKLPNLPTKAHVKFESHRISFDDGSPPIKRFSLTRMWFYSIYACISLSIGGTILHYSSKFAQRPYLYEPTIHLKSLKALLFEIFWKKLNFSIFFVISRKHLNLKHRKHQHTLIWKLKSAKVSKLSALLAFSNIWQ